MGGRGWLVGWLVPPPCLCLCLTLPPTHPGLPLVDNPAPAVRLAVEPMMRAAFDASLALNHGPSESKTSISRRARGFAGTTNGVLEALIDGDWHYPLVDGCDTKDFVETQRQWTSSSSRASKGTEKVAATQRMLLQERFKS